MSDLPEDLIQIQRDLYAARAAADTYAAAVAEERRALFPDPEQAVERQQDTPEQRAELDRLRAAYTAAFEAKWEHPLLVRARAERTYKQVDEELRQAAAQD
jgi:hypothetical protein